LVFLDGIVQLRHPLSQSLGFFPSLVPLLASPFKPLGCFRASQFRLLPRLRLPYGSVVPLFHFPSPTLRALRLALQHAGSFALLACLGLVVLALATSGGVWARVFRIGVVDTAEATTLREALA